MNVFKEMVHSVYDFEAYQGFLENKKFKIFRFGMLVLTLYFAAIILIPLARFYVSPTGIKTGLEKWIPEFELKDGTLWIERPVEFDYGTTYAYVDTDTVLSDVYDMRQYLRGYSSAILMDSQKMIIKNDGEVEQIYYTELTTDTWTRETLLEYLLQLIPYLYTIIGIVVVVLYLFMAGAFFFGALILALLGMIVASCMKYQLTFGQLYILAVYSKTLPLVIKALVWFLPFGIPFFWLISLGISLLYMSRAIGRLKEQQLEKPLEFSSEENNF